MKKTLKTIGLSLCTIMALAGCSCKKNEDVGSTKANINNGSENIVSGLKENTKSITLQNLYDDLKASVGNEAAADKLLQIIADLVLSDQVWKDRYDAKVEEKLLELAKDTTYQVNGHFNEELLVKSLRAGLYNVTCNNNEYGPIYAAGSDIEVEKYMICDYSDYVKKNLNLEILTELLNEKYIYDKVMVDKPDILSTKKARIVEYVAISYTSSDEKKLDEFIAQSVKELAAESSSTTLESIKDAWKNKKIEELMEKYNKIGTKDDANGSILSEFTGGYLYSKEEGLKIAKEKIYANADEYYKADIITSDSKAILTEALVSRLLNENILSETAKRTIKINGSYYLIAPWAGTANIKPSDIRIKDTTNSKYYLVKVDVINNDSSDALKYDAVKVLATNSSLVSDSINYYLDKYKNEISVHDDEIYAYLKTQYGNIFVD